MFKLGLKVNTSSLGWRGLGPSRQRNMCSIKEIWNCVVYASNYCKLIQE